VLQRRPDVASAERAMQAANAQIGLARAAFFPAISLSAAPGVQSNALGQLFNASSNMWSFGIAASQLIFDGGRSRARVAYAEAGYQATAASYRQTVLTALQEVQDGLSSLATLDVASNKAQAAVASARTVFDYAQQRYQAGVASRFDLVNAQQGYLNNQRLATQVRGQQWLTAIYLVKALGGGWQGMANDQDVR
jgi:NodT family efflux transporter outer membrane factor (OMF) lipoprotein